MLTRPDGASPMPSFGLRQRTPVPPQDSPTPGPAPTHGESLQPPPHQQHAASGDGSLAVPMDLSNVTMDYMQDMIMKGGSVILSDLWPLNNALDNEKNLADMLASQPHGSDYQNHIPYHDQQVRQQALNQQMQHPKDDNAIPPYLWTDPFAAMNSNFADGAAGEDADMLGDEFDWQSWSQSIRGLETESTQQPQRGW